MSDNWWFIQSMSKAKEEEVASLEKIYQSIKDAANDEKFLRAKLDMIPESSRKSHPIRIEWITARSKYWSLIAEMREIEKDMSPKSATDK